MRLGNENFLLRHGQQKRHANVGFGERIAIVKSSGGYTNESCNLIAKEARERGHEVFVVDPKNTIPFIQNNALSLLYRQQSGNFGKLPKPDAVITRIGPENTISKQDLTIARQLEEYSKYHVSVDKPDALVRSYDKFNMHQLLVSAGIPTPDTFKLLNTDEDLDEKLGTVLQEIKSDKVIIKLPSGGQGTGVFIAPKNADEIKAKVKQVIPQGQDFLVQEFLATPGGKASDLRAVVIDNKLIGAYRRIAKDGDFRANISKGGSFEKAKLTEQEKEIALKSAKISGLDVAGVDIMRTVEKGPVVLEVNYSPGVSKEGKKLFGVYVPTKILELVEGKIAQAKQNLAIPSC